MKSYSIHNRTPSLNYKNSIIGLAFTGIVIAIGLLNQRQNIADLLSIVFISFSMVYTIINWRWKVNAPFMIKCYWLLLVIAIVNSSIFLFREDHYSIIKIISGLFPFVLVILYYHLLQSRQITESILIRLAIFMMLFAGFMAYQNSLNFSEITTRQARTNWANLAGACVPLLFLVRSRALKLLLIILASIILFISLKRTGILVALFAVFTFYLVEFRAVGGMKKYINLVFIGSILIFVIWFGNSIRFFEAGYQRILLLAEDGGAGRVDFISEAWSAFLGFNFFQQIVGVGGQSFGLIVDGKFSSHNDLVDFAISYGLPGVILISLIYFRLFYICYSFKNNEKFGYALVTSFTAFLYGNAASSHYYFYFFVPLFISVAYLELLYKRSLFSRV